MTLEELRLEVGAIAALFDDLADRAQRDEFAPWVVEALRQEASHSMAALAEERLHAVRREMVV
jgi:hypothetical protein